MEQSETKLNFTAVKKKEPCQSGSGCGCDECGRTTVQRFGAEDLVFAVVSPIGTSLTRIGCCSSLHPYK